ncbi:OmpA family protein [Saprospiraceae bacterium]|nr:OmpA family protein [Saprospiraceae bacterium]
MKSILTFLLSVSSVCVLLSQSIVIDGYTFETGNRGFIADAKVVIMSGDDILKTTIADKEGHFYATVPEKDNYTLKLTSELYEDLTMSVRGDSKTDENKIFVKAAMKRLPGYLFELTMAEERQSEDSIVDAISDTRIDIFNNTKFEEVKVYENYPYPEFSVPLFKENHYTLLIRKEGYIAKRIEAFVDVQGCILCFEGLGSVSPGVTENLSRGNQIGVLLANVSLERAFSGKTIVLQDLYYDFGRAYLTQKAKRELNNLTRMMRDNPEIKVELGAHTDSRGDAEKNRVLSDRRAANAVKYLIGKGIDEERIISFGYGETQLTNECADGVKCSEEKHAVNRRTELKIIDIVKSDDAVKSLKQMKMMERAEKEMESLAFGGQVKIEEKEKSAEEPIEDNFFEKEIIEDSSLVIQVLDSSNVTNVVDPAEIEYKIVIKTTTYQIPADHDLYKTHKDLLEVESNGRYKYLIGSFSDLKDVQKFMKNTVTLVYPKAEIVKFSNGEIL